MKNLGNVMLFLGLISTSVSAVADKSRNPAVSLHGDTLSIDGQYAHIKGKMPLKSANWYYNVELKNENLFIFTFWIMDEFQDTKEESGGLYEAKAWTVQVLDSKADPEKRVIYDHLSDFQFWGNVVDKADHVEVTIDSIDGMPKSPYGPVILNKALKNRQQ